MDVKRTLVVFVKFAFGKMKVSCLYENARCPLQMARINNVRDRIKDENGNQRREQKT